MVRTLQTEGSKRRRGLSRSGCGLRHSLCGCLSVTFGNGREQSRTYDLNYGIDAVTDSAPDGVAIDYGLDDVGNVTALDERLKTGAVANRVVEYDGLDRLAALKDGSTTLQGFSYDATGNRLQKVAGSTESYSYEPASHRLTQTGAVARSYDAAGHGTGIGTKTFTYDDHGRRVQYLNNGTLAREYRYNGRGERVAKLNTPAPEDDRYYVYDETGHLLGEYRADGSRVAEYVWMDDTLVAVMSTHYGSYQQYVLTDHLNTPRAVVRPDTNTIVWRWDLTPTAFGDHAADNDPDGDGIAFTFNLRYPGQFYDSETGLHYNYFRDYESGTGRYLQSDPIGLEGGAATFSYVASRPLELVDPNGLEGVGYWNNADTLSELAPNRCVANATVDSLLNITPGLGLLRALKDPNPADLVSGSLVLVGTPAMLTSDASTSDSKDRLRTLIKQNRNRGERESLERMIAADSGTGRLLKLAGKVAFFAGLGIEAVKYSAEMEKCSCQN